MRALILLALMFLALPAWAQEIKLATWNIAWLTTKPAGHPDLPQNLTIRTEQDFARLRAYAERLAADVIALQEVDGPLAAARAVIFAQMVDDPSTYVSTLRSDAKLKRKAESGLKERLKLWHEARDLVRRAEGTNLDVPEPVLAQPRRTNRRHRPVGRHIERQAHRIERNGRGRRPTRFRGTRWRIFRHSRRRG
jgi:hypothetical protein